MLGSKLTRTVMEAPMHARFGGNLLAEVSVLMHPTTVMTILFPLLVLEVRLCGLH